MNRRPAPIDSDNLISARFGSGRFSSPRRIEQSPYVPKKRKLKVAEEDPFTQLFVIQ